ncbi:MAG: ABC transporter permease [Tannerellaceae bacterium]|jgi:putative ABC transport system permease protein|nr:ABC transporter permease [Tannerellaceae bacterium]
MKTILRNFLSVLRRFKMATALNVLGLSVAFAAFMIILMQVEYDYTFDRSHPHADRIYRVEACNLMGNDRASIICRPFMEAFASSSPHILAGTYTNLPRRLFFSVESGGSKHFFLEESSTVSPGYADVFAFDMLEGDARTLDEPDRALIPESLAKKLFGREPATGRRLEGRDRAYTVGGVYRDFPRNASTSNRIYIRIPQEENQHNWGNWNYTAYVRLDDPRSAEGLWDNFSRTFDTSTLDGWDAEELASITLRLTPLPEVHFVTGVAYDEAPKSSRQTLLILLGIALAIVAIAGINYTNFSAALTPKRIRSINTQKVLGGDVRVIRLALVAEGVAMAFVSFLLALLWVALAGGTAVASLVDAEVSPSAHPGLAALTGGAALATGLLAGLWPARYMTSFPPALALKGSFGLSPRGRRLRSLLIGVQFVASFVLVTGASFMYLQNRFMQGASLGFGKEQLVVTTLNATVCKSLDAFESRLKSFAGVDDLTFGQSLLSGGDTYMGWGRKYRDEDIYYQCLPVDPSFLRVMGIEVTEGRSFRQEDALTRHGAYVFNEKARAAYHLELNGRIDSAEIIGFMPDVKFASLRQEVSPMAFYVWGTQNWGARPNYAYIKVKAGSDMREAIEHVRRTLKEFDGEYPFDVRFFDEVLNRTYEKERQFGTLISLFSLVAILISIVGVFGLVVFDSEYRRKEISLRKVFGATTGGILLMFGKTYLRLLAISFLIAAPLAWYAVSRWLENFAYRTPLHWWVYALAFVMVSLITIATVTFQNWRAANANPAESIKTE